ncbi:MAG: AMP-binding protein, partial [Flavobacteriaceae bacterium]
MKTRLQSFQNKLEQQLQRDFKTYSELHQYSVNNLAEFWQCLAEFFEIKFFDKPQRLLKTGDHLIDTRWFTGATLSYTFEVFKHFKSDEVAIHYSDEEGNSLSVSWPSLLAKVLHYKNIFEQYGLKKGDRVAGYVLNRPDTVAAFLATNALGAIWASCPPEFGDKAVQDRFELIEPKLLVAHTGYTFRGKYFDRSEVLQKLEEKIPSIEHSMVLDLDFTEESYEIDQLAFEKVGFDHPIWILFSSGTTGKPKAITHRTGGMILEHCKALGLHQDVHSGDRYFWYSTTGWMMYNYSLGSLLLGATLCLYHGDSFYPNP